MGRIYAGPRTYVCIDLKSFYASVECSDRNLDALTTNLVVADPTRTEKTICLAVSPSLKVYGIPGRARLFEVIQRVKEINAERFRKAQRLGLLLKGEDGRDRFTSTSFDADALASDPSLELSYIIAPPRMKRYEKVSTKIFSIYMKHVSPDDIHVYSIDECFMDLTPYIKNYKITAHELVLTMIHEVLRETGITATAGIGTNMYLAKIAMDIVAKHVSADKDGVRIAELDERSYREKLWSHEDLTDFWRIGHGTEKHLFALGCRTMGDVARLSIRNEGRLYETFGINAELIIDHAWGWEPTEISTIKAYKPESNSLSSGQVLTEPYDFEKGKLIVREMTELLTLDLVGKGVVTQKMGLNIGYDRASLTVAKQGSTIKDSVYNVARTGQRYTGVVTADHYGRPHPKYAHGTGNIDRWTNSTRRIMEVMMDLYDRIVDPDLLIRRVNVVALDIISEDKIPPREPEQLDLFTDYAALEKERASEKAKDEKERKLQEATLLIQSEYGKNAILKGFNLQEGATTIARNEQIGGHKAGDDTCQTATVNIDESSETRTTYQPYKSGAGIQTRTSAKKYSKKEPDPRHLYADIIDMPHHQSRARAHMSLYDRAAQFSPFAALSGFEKMIEDEVTAFEDQT